MRFLVHEAMLEEGIERLVARTGNGARLKEHLLASHSFPRKLGALPAMPVSKTGAQPPHFRPTIPRYGEADWEVAVRKSWA